LAFVIAFAALSTAALEARMGARRPASNPLTIDRLRHLHVWDEVLLWMLYQGYCEHLHLPSSSCGPSGAVESAIALLSESLVIGPHSAFALTEPGEEFAGWLLMALLLPEDEEVFSEACRTLELGRFVPSYDRQERVFCWGHQLVKCFRQPSVNQELILSAAEELGWPMWFDDPLPGCKGRSAKVRLHDTIKDLNRRQKAPLIHFKGDGTGRRVGCELH
jgi:hypothetical protein